VDQHQHLVILMGGTWAPVEAACDHGLAIDHSELVVELVQKCLPAWFSGTLRGPEPLDEPEALIEKGSGYERLRRPRDGLASPISQL
jgi:hypothetical protein